MYRMVIIHDIKSFKKKVQNKLRDYKRVDEIKLLQYPLENLKTINMNDAIEIITKLDNDICPGCGCKMLFSNYIPYCLYQFSFDRIDNCKIHSVDNLRIVCYDCNSMGMGHTKQNCSRGCHQLSDDICSEPTPINHEEIEINYGPVKYKNNTKKTYIANKILNKEKYKMTSLNEFGLIVDITNDVDSYVDFIESKLDILNTEQLTYVIKHMFLDSNLSFEKQLQEILINQKKREE